MKKVFKILGNTSASMLALVLLIIGIAYLHTVREINRAYQIQAAAIVIPTDSASMAWGKHIVDTRGCANCHGNKLEGMINKEADNFLVGHMAAPNLTGGNGGA